jgi:predicted permease
VTQVALLLVSFAAGLVLQRHGPRLRRALWLGHFSLLAPVLVFVTFATLRVDRTLLLALAAVVAGSWLVAGTAFAYARLVGRTRAERGALALGASFGNTGFVGLPLAQLAFGHAGLALAVVYGRLAWLVPDTAISTAIARVHGRRSGDRRAWVRALLLNPPLAALVAALVARAAGAVPDVGGARDVAAALVGPSGFLLLGISLPLERVAHAAGDVPRAAGALAIRFVAGPSALWLAGRAIGADVPGVFYLLAGMPSAFHLLVLARVYDLRPRLMRLIVVGSTIAAVAAVVVGTRVAG